jgi:hypothetical protein
MACGRRLHLTWCGFCQEVGPPATLPTHSFWGCSHLQHAVCSVTHLILRTMHAKGLLVWKPPLCGMLMSKQCSILQHMQLRLTCAWQASCVPRLVMEGPAHVTTLSLWWVRRRIPRLPTSKALHAPAAVRMWSHAGPELTMSVMEGTWQPAVAMKWLTLIMIL